MRIIGEASDDEMIACFLAGELTSHRFGPALRAALAAAGLREQVVTDPDLTSPADNQARRELLGETRGYGRGQDVFDADFPPSVRWIRAELSPAELARVRYIEYCYWNELSGGSRLPADAATRIQAGTEVFGVSNQRFLDAAAAVARGERFGPLILAGPALDDLVCVEGHLRLTGYALAGFPVPAECLIAAAPELGRWARRCTQVDGPTQNRRGRCQRGRAARPR